MKEFLQFVAPMPVETAVTEKHGKHNQADHAGGKGSGSAKLERPSETHVLNKPTAGRGGDIKPSKPQQAKMNDLESKAKAKGRNYQIEAARSGNVEVSAFSGKLDDLKQFAAESGYTVVSSGDKPMRKWIVVK